MEGLFVLFLLNRIFEAQAARESEYLKENKSCLGKDDIVAGDEYTIESIDNVTVFYNYYKLKDKSENTYIAEECDFDFDDAEVGDTVVYKGQNSFVAINKQRKAPDHLFYISIIGMIIAFAVLIGFVVLGNLIP